MQHAHHPGRWVAALALAALSVTACAKTGSEEEESNRGATVDSVPGSDIGAVTLTDVAENRIDLKTAAIAQAADGMQIPYSALLYDPEGKTWAFVKIGDHQFQRQADHRRPHHRGHGVPHATGPRPAARSSSSAPPSCTASRKASETSSRRDGRTGRKAVRP